MSAINKYSNNSTLGLDKLSWRHLKEILKNSACLDNVLNIANTCIDLGHWSSHFKVSMSIIIPKPNKTLYDTSKTFRPIVLLNMLSKLIKKFVSKRLQFQALSNNMIYLCQLGGLKQQSMTDASTFLMYLICLGQIKNHLTSTLAFDIAQFIPSFNNQMLPLIMNKAGFDPRISCFFSNYLIERKTKYFWNNFSSLFFDVNVGVEQGSALSPIPSTLYLLLVFHIFEKRLKNLEIPVYFISFVNDGLLISQNKSFEILNTNLFCSYHVIFLLLDCFGLVTEQGKAEVFHFSRAQEAFNPFSLDISILGEPVLCSKEI